MKRILYIIVICSFFSSCSLFKAIGKNHPPLRPTLLFPANEQPDVEADSLTLSWECRDENNDNLSYTVYLSSDSLFMFNRPVALQILETSCSIERLRYEDTFYWKVIAYDGEFQTESILHSFTTTIPDFPEWWKEHINEEYIFFCGTSLRTSQVVSVDDATENAISFKKRNINKFVKKLMKRFKNEALLTDKIALKMMKEVIKLTSKYDYKEMKISKQETVKISNGKFRSFVQMKLIKRDVLQILLKKIKSAGKLYEELQYSESFVKLEKEFE